MNSICLALHAISSGTVDEPLVNKALSISESEFEDLIIRLLKAGFLFSELGDNTQQSTQPKCYITFDDGYRNSLNFLKLAEKYHIPFTYFLTGFNILNEIPFIWDIYEYYKLGPLSHFASFSHAYDKIRLQDMRPLLKQSHKPLSLNDLEFLDKHELVSFANHGFTHQSYVSGYESFIREEVNKGEDFLRRYKSYKNSEFALPSGLHTKSAIKDLSCSYRRIYTIQGGYSDLSKSLVNRISLVNPKFNIDLMGQIKRSLLKKSKAKRTVSNLINSYKFFNL
jgi:peptidoglycan/xylan/chitin deacetylase (PgdA/CDA1 family)